MNEPIPPSVSCFEETALISSFHACVIFIKIINLGISFMQSIYIYVPERNHIPREHCDPNILM
jgi:hypothetical protein